jgi:hypothetical protein
MTGVANALTRIFSLRGEPLLSLTPRFSGVIGKPAEQNCFNSFRPSSKTVKTVANGSGHVFTPLKRGVYERPLSNRLPP